MWPRDSGEMVEEFKEMRKERRQYDAYYTDQRLADAICAKLNKLFVDVGVSIPSILEPACGRGAFIRAARKTWPDAYIHAQDIDPNVTEQMAKDAGASKLSGFSRPSDNYKPKDFRLVISNPPFNQAEAFVERAFDHQMSKDGYVAFLLRLSFLCGKRRLDSIYRKHGVPNLIPIVPRPSFTEDGKTDASEYSLFLWEGEHNRMGPPCVFDAIEWR